LAIRFVRLVTVATTVFRLPRVSVSRYTHREPGRIGQYGFVMVVEKSVGSSRLGSLPCGSAAALVAAPEPERSPLSLPQATRADARIAAPVAAMSLGPVMGCLLGSPP
jgi:hypothetical protein